MLVVKNVMKNLGGREILHSLNFCLNEGEIIALLGPNGAGKTTLLRCLTGFYRADGGEISFDGLKAGEDREKYAAKIAYMPETGGLYPEMTVFEYLRFTARIKRLSEQKTAAGLARVIKVFDLADVLLQKCETLSKGYKRRTALAGAVLAEPELLILDEPSEGLDPQQKQQLRRFLKEYGKKHIVLVATHVMEEVDALADRVLLIKGGRLLCDTTPAELKKVSRQNTVEESVCAIIGD